MNVEIDYPERVKDLEKAIVVLAEEFRKYSSKNLAMGWMIETFAVGLNTALQKNRYQGDTINSEIASLLDLYEKWKKANT